MPTTISTLEERPQFAGIITKRCWHAWWQDSEVSLSQYRDWVDECLKGNGVPSCFVAHDGEAYLGSACLIANDLEARPHYTPWIAALWVEPAHRRLSIATTLMDRATIAARELGIAQVYLCAVPEKTAYYARREFSIVETEVEGLTIFKRATAHI